VGCSLACNEITVLRPDGGEADPLERGEIAIRGPAVMSGYLNNPEANARGFREDWFLSGDQGFYQVDETGRKFFFISGRLKELIIRGGVNISPLEIDEVLSRVEGVAFALALPFENTFYGEEIAAYIVPEAGVELDEAAIMAHARQQLPPAKCPKLIIFGTEVPFTATGKPKRLQLAQMLAEQFKAYRTHQFRESS
jgi:long-chain acyl-CoA synthetase